MVIESWILKRRRRNPGNNKGGDSMNAIDGVNFGFSVQLGNMNYENMENRNTLEAPPAQGANSFLSILNLLDVNADGKIDPEELKFGAGFMINSLIQAKDQDGDQALSAEEAGVSPGTVSQLDTNSDQQLSAGEMITAADKIIDGLVPVLDTNGDGALSREELAVFELLFTGHSSIASTNVNDTQAVQQGTEAYQATVPVTGTSSELQKNVSLKV
jgi:hypothetical protein